MLGIDAPEKGEPGNKEVTDYLSTRLLGKKVVVRFKAINIYRRQLGIVYLDQININV